MRLLLPLLLFSCFAHGQYAYKIGLLKYNGGGDWYANLDTSIPNLVAFANENAGLNIDPDQAIVQASDRALFNYPFIHMTGHGNVVFSASEVDNLRKYLIGGGFLHIDDNFGMDPFIRPQMKKVFPELDFIELPAQHAIFHQTFDFNGLPKIHEHEGSRPQALALIYEGRVVCLYTYECDLGDGWEDARIHNDSPEVRTKALQMGSNILEFAFMNNVAGIEP